MVFNDEEFQKRLLATFRIEADEHLTALFRGLVELERPVSDEAKGVILERVFREVHSLKGAARAVGRIDIESLCQAQENIFSALRGGRLALSPPLLDLCHRAADALQILLAADAGPEGDDDALHRLIDQLYQAAAGDLPQSSPPLPAAPRAAPTPAAPPPPGPTTEPQTQTLRISSSRLIAILLQIEELIPEKLASHQGLELVQGLAADVAAWQRRWRELPPLLRAAQQSAPVNSPVAQLVTFLEQGRATLDTLGERIRELETQASRHRRFLGNKVDRLLGDIKQALLLPLASLLEIFPKLVRDLAHDQGKEVHLVMEGDTVEIDRRVLEQLKDPLVHLVRNAIDHGLESPGDRELTGKSRQGRLRLSCRPYEGKQVEIVLSDDGPGIDLERVRQRALRSKLISEQKAEQLGPRETLQLIFESGLSTSPLVTDISGRGLGLAIVRDKVASLGGSVTVASEPGKGTRFRLLLPLTVATFRGILLRQAGRNYILPHLNIEGVHRLPSAAFRTVEGLDSVVVQGQTLALADLGVLLDLPHAGPTAAADREMVQVVILTAAGERIALRVEAILEEQEVLQKNLGRQLVRVRHISGAALLGTGQLVPVLNGADLVASAVRSTSGPAERPTRADAEETAARSILVVEDSITSRMLLKNILESVGYAVQTAIDGIDGFTQAKTGHFDLIISDVDMPRMSGFDLTAKIRGDRTLAEIPVILVTSLQTREDRERGVEVGANAYIVKSDFNQSVLLETIARLI